MNRRGFFSGILGAAVVAATEMYRILPSQRSEVSSFGPLTAARREELLGTTPGAESFTPQYMLTAKLLPPPQGT